MEELNFDADPINSRPSAVIEHLQSNPDCTKLLLTNNKIDSVQAETLFRYLGENDSIQELNIAMNHIGQIRVGEARGVDLRGVEALSHYVRSSEKLEILWINANCIGAKGLERLSEALAQNESLKTMYVGSNPIRGEAGNEIIFGRLREGIIKNTSLEEVNISMDCDQYVQEINRIVGCDYQENIVNKFCEQRQISQAILDLDEEEYIFLSKEKNMLNVIFDFVVKTIGDGVEFEGAESLLADASIGCPKESCCAKLIDVVTLESGPFSSFNPEFRGQIQGVLTSIAPQAMPETVMQSRPVDQSIILRS